MNVTLTNDSASGVHSRQMIFAFTSDWVGAAEVNAIGASNSFLIRFAANSPNRLSEKRIELTHQSNDCLVWTRNSAISRGAIKIHL